MKKYDDNIPLLKNRVETHAFIRNISKHRLPDGTLDVEGNLKLWNDGMQGFVKTPLWEKTPGWREDTHLQGEPYLVFVPGNPGSPTILIAHGGGFSWRTGCEGPNVAWYFHQAGYNTAILSYRLLPYDRYASMADMQRAIRLLRARKEEFGIGEKIVVMGFSAGGMICGNCATHFDNGSQTAPDLVQQMSSRPDALQSGANFVLVGLICITLEENMKNSDVINKILKYHPQFPDNYAGCDGYKFGDPNAECNGIATALVPTVDVIRRTGELGCNLLVVHEPIFYSTEDYPDWRAGGKNSVYEEKKALLDKYGITVWRDHDHMHAHNPDSIFTGVIKYLGWENYYIPSEKSSIKVPMGYLFELPETTVKELGQYLEDKLAMNGLRIVGNPEDKIRKVAIVGHLFPGFGTQSETREYGTDLINAMEQGLDAIIPGEVIEWTVLSYVRDALALGRKKAVFNIGHFNMEELGMRYAQDWIGDLVDHKVPVHYLPTKDIYRYIERKHL